jgi:iron complex outermembrane receptor protein
MFKKSSVATAIWALTTGLVAPSAYAQDQDGAAKLERVEVTGSSIKRISGEGALPVTVLTQADIKRSGATSVTDLIQNLPAMQGFVPASSSVNGGGAGVTTAALHSLASKYTLVLLDGKRVAPLALGNSQGGGFGVNLESIPVNAIERVEILADGASALYGSDAIAGVVNFILKKNKTDGDIELTYNKPQHSGGGSWNVGLSKGFGNLESDGFNLLLAYSHDHQDKLQASQRPFSARGAYFPFSANGKNYIYDARTSNVEPANVTFATVPKGADPKDENTTVTAVTLNPYYLANGNCGTPLAGVQIDPPGSVGSSCRFNYAATVQDIPGSKRDSGMVKGTLKLNDSTTVWGLLNLSQYSMLAQYAPSAQPLGLTPTNNGVLYTKYVQPYLTAHPEVDLVAGSGKLGYRSVSLGGRTDEYTTNATHLSFGIDGMLAGWDYNASLTLSRAKYIDRAAGGYSDATQVITAIANGTYDPVMGTGADKVASAVLGSEFSHSISTLNSFHAGASRELFSLPGGPSVLALGGDFARTAYKTVYSDLILSQSGFATQPVSSNFPIGGNYGQVPFDASRTNWGVYGEWLLPVLKQLEVTASARYDSYSKTTSRYVFDVNPDGTGLYPQLPNAKLGNTFNSATGKLSFRYTPNEVLLVRGSYGTGFKAPNISDIAGALVFGGSTQGTYACPFPGSSGCLPGSAQYDLVAGPNGASGSAGLKPEKSKQWTIGFRVDPNKSLSFGMDLWEVKLRDQILSQGIAEQVGFKDPTTYKYLFIDPYQDPAGFTTIAFKQLPFNGGKAQYQGIDWDLSFRTKTDFGALTAQVYGSQILKQRYNFGPDQPMNTDLGVFGPDQQVVFRTTLNFMLGLQSGAFANTLAMHYKSGYRDQEHSADEGVVFLANPDGTAGAPADISGLRVKSYMTFDWQTKYTFNKSLQFTFGIKNLFDKEPPFTLQNGGGGNQVGYDGRYADPIGRQYYLSAAYKF